VDSICGAFASPRRLPVLTQVPNKLATFLIAFAALAAAGYAGWHASRPHPPVAFAYRTALVERGPVEVAVTASGTVNAVLTVQVGSQVAGRITALHADFNNDVRRGQTLARIDPEPFERRIAQADADLAAARTALGVAQRAVEAMHVQLARTRVQGLDAQREVERRHALVERGVVAPVDAERADAAHRDVVQQVRAAEAQLALLESQVENARAVARQRETALSQARLDLERTYVRAPVDGIVITRAVEVGQTVPAGVGAAALFTIARDLREMQVDMAVAEADVGRLRVGQRATFTVDAFPRRTFEGRIVQIRKAPVRHGDATTYTAVVSAPNADLALLPGMTARVRVVVESRDDALKVPNAALRFRAEPDALAGASVGRVWRMADTGPPAPHDVEIGVSDGNATEVVGESLKEGDAVVTGIVPALPGALARHR
jgi:HlyD family secretion protein